MIRCRTVRRTVKKLYEGGKRNTLYVCTAGGVEAYTQRGFILFAYTLQVHTAGTAGKYQNVGPLLFYDTYKSIENAGIPKCRKS
jgi:hypothetical protein